MMCMQVSEFRESFEVFDADGSGEIDAEELKTLLEAFGQVNPSFKSFLEQFACLPTFERNMLCRNLYLFYLPLCLL